MIKNVNVDFNKLGTLESKNSKCWTFLLGEMKEKSLTDMNNERI